MDHIFSHSWDLLATYGTKDQNLSSTRIYRFCAILLTSREPVCSPTTLVECFPPRCTQFKSVHIERTVSQPTEGRGGHISLRRTWVRSLHIRNAVSKITSELRRSALIADYLERQTSPTKCPVISNYLVMMHAHIIEAHTQNLHTNICCSVGCKLSDFYHMKLLYWRKLLIVKCTFFTVNGPV